MLDQYVEAVVRGEDVAQRYAWVLTHLGYCDACREDAAGLLAALNDTGPPLAT